MNINALINKTRVLVVVILTFCIVLSPVSARTIEEINADIKASQEEMQKIKEQLAKANSDLAAIQANKNKTGSEINKIKEQINELQISYDLAVLQKQQMEEEIKIKDLEKEEREKLLNKQLVVSYVDWKTNKATETMLNSSGDVLKSIMYYDFITAESSKGLKELSQNITALNEQTKEFEAQVLGMQTTMADLQKQKEFWEKQIALYNEALAKASNDKNQLQVASSQISETQAQYNLELEIAVAAANSGSEPLISGELYFAGSVSLPRNGIECTGNYRYAGFNPGTDAFGHGLGMSQWGAFGMAQNHGWNANRILTFYYQGSAIETRPTKTIKVNGVDRMNMEDYIAGIGEVPDKACGTAEQIQNWENYANSQGWSPTDPKRQKYLVGGNCWPEEAIKAQAIAARTYAYNRADSICTTDSCQVYKGGYAKAWAAYETNNQVIVAGGNVINAFYSGYNNNGAGTADIETVWPKSSPVSYLKSVNDNSVTYTPRLCNQNVRRENWNTNSYSLDAIKEMLNWLQSKSNWTDCDNGIEPNRCNADAVRYQIVNVIGNLTAMQVENDSSGRAKRVKFIGTNGTGSVSGLFFRMMFNTWTGKTGKNDALKSITYDIKTAQ